MDEAVLNGLRESFKAQEIERTAELTKKALDAGADPQELIDAVIGIAKKLTEKSWWAGGNEAASGVDDSEALLLTDLMLIGDCLKASTDLIKPALLKSGKKGLGGKMVLGTIEGDVHDIGKSLVKTILESAGYAVEDLGTDVPAKSFVNEAKRLRADIVGVSVSMSMAKTGIATVSKELKKAGIRDNVRIMFGGQATFGDEATELGADAWAADARMGLEKADELIRVMRENAAKKAQRLYIFLKKMIER